MARKTDIRLRRSNTANAVPTSGNLNLGELALNTADGALYFKKSDDTIITAHDDTILHIDSDNNRVGIGTTSPARILDVNSGTIDFGIRALSTDTKSGIIVQAVSDSSHFMTAGGKTSLGASSNADGTNLTILSTGAVGIGTASPSTKFHVVHNSRQL